MPQFPYAVIAPGVTADELRDGHPWLWRMVLMVASFHERGRQIEEAKRLVTELSCAVGAFSFLACYSVTLFTPTSRFSSAITWMSEISCLCLGSGTMLTSLRIDVG